MYSSREEIVTLYTDHMDSLKSWGGEADIEGVEALMNHELLIWDQEHESDK